MRRLFKKIRNRILISNVPLPKYFKIAEFLEPNKKILDFGCFHGNFSKFIIQQKNINVIGCDLINECNFKNERFKYIKVTKENNFPFKENFDYIIFGDVLEHLERPKYFLEEAFKYTNKVIVSIPNLNFFLFRLFPNLENPPIGLTPHLNHWTLHSFKEIIPFNADITNVRYCSDFPEFRWTNHFPFKNKSFFNQTLIMEIQKKNLY